MVLSGDHQIPIKIPSAAAALSLPRRKFPFLTLFIDNFNVFHEIQQDKSVSNIIFRVFLLVLGGSEPIPLIWGPISPHQYLAPNISQSFSLVPCPAPRVCPVLLGLV